MPPCLRAFVPSPIQHSAFSLQPRCLRASPIQHSAFSLQHSFPRCLRASPIQHSAFSLQHFFPPAAFVPPPFSTQHSAFSISSPPPHRPAIPLTLSRLACGARRASSGGTGLRALVTATPSDGSPYSPRWGRHCLVGQTFLSAGGADILVCWWGRHSCLSRVRERGMYSSPRADSGNSPVPPRLRGAVSNPHPPPRRIRTLRTSGR